MASSTKREPGGALAPLQALEALRIQDQPRVARFPSLRRLVRLREPWLGKVAVTDLAAAADLEIIRGCG